MIGFIKKDLYFIKGNLKMFLIIIAAFTAMSFVGTANLSFLLPFISIMLIISTFSYDDYNQWNAYLLSFPNGRENAVKGKYVFSLLTVLISSLLSFLLSFLVGIIQKDYQMEGILGSCVGGLIATVLIVSIFYPVIYKYGTEKGRNILFIGTLLLAFIFGFLVKWVSTLTINFTPFLEFLSIWGYVIVPIVLILMLYVSYRISKKIVIKKEY